MHSGNIEIDSAKTFRDYITEYQFNAKNDEIHKITKALGLDESKLRSMMNSAITPANINVYGRFDDLKNTVDKAKARSFFEKHEGTSIPPFKVNIKIHKLLQDFILKGGFEIDSPD